MESVTSNFSLRVCGPQLLEHAVLTDPETGATYTLSQSPVLETAMFDLNQSSVVMLTQMDGRFAVDFKCAKYAIVQCDIFLVFIVLITFQSVWLLSLLILRSPYTQKKHAN